MWKLFFEIVAKMRENFINKRLKMPFRQNLALILFVLAGIAFLMVILQTFFPGMWY